MDFVRCTEVVRLSESPLLEVSLYNETYGVVYEVQCNLDYPDTFGHSLDAGISEIIRI